MQQNDLRPDQVAEVRGFADQRLRNADDPTDPSNRRITVIVKYVEKPPSPPDNTAVGEHPQQPSDPAKE
jgi:chemotaxis protein MotB